MPTTLSSAPPLRQMLAELIAIPSISSVDPQADQSNLPLLERLANWLDAAGFAVEILPLPGHPGKANLLAVLGTGSDGLVLSGHADTVPYDAEQWHYDPFRLTEDAGRLHGLGICDMKAFLALAIEAARDLRATDLRQPLTILATADEESAMHGARALVEAARPLGRHAIIGEPTSLRPVRLHKGVMGEAIRLRGLSGHASDPRLGRNALEGMHAVIGALLDWRGEWQRQHRHAAFGVPEPTLNLGAIRGGDNPNRICGECELRIDLRLLPGMDPDALRAQLAAQVAAVAEPRALAWTVTPLFPSIPPGETPASAAIVSAAETLTGHAAEAVNFGTELPFLNRLGLATLILGPGDIAQAHQPDEYLPVARLAPTVALLQQLITHFCRAAPA